MDSFSTAKKLFLEMEGFEEDKHIIVSAFESFGRSSVESDCLSTELRDRESSASSNSRVLTIFLILNSMIGSGILNQPYVFKSSGVVAAFVMFVVASIFIWIGIVALIDCGIKTGQTDYSQLALRVFGKYGEMLVDVSIVIGNFGALMSYVDVIGLTASDLFFSWGCTSSIGCGPYLITILIFFIFVYPVCLKRFFGELAWFSVFSMGAIISIFFLVIIAGPIEAVNGTVMNFNSSFGSSLGSIIFALSCAFAAFPAFKSMKDRDQKSWRYVTAVSVFSGFVLCAAMGIAGYTAFKDETNGIILNNFTGHYADFFKVLLIIHLILYIPVEYVILRHSLLKLCGRNSGMIESDFYHALVSFLILFVAVVVILILYSVGFTQGNAFALVIDFSGGVAGSLTSFIIPAALYLKLMKRQEELFYPCILMMIFGLFAVIYIPIETVMVNI